MENSLVQNYRDKALENRNEIKDLMYKAITTKILNTMDSEVEKGLLNFSICFDEEFRYLEPFYKDRDEALSSIINKIKDDTRFQSPFFDIEILQYPKALKPGIILKISY